VQIEPAFPTVPWERQRFSVFVTAQDLAHDGAISYDDDDDGVADRQVPSVGLGAFELHIQYDPAVLRLEGAAPGPSLTGGTRSFQCLQRSEAGAFAFGCVSSGSTPPGPQGDLTLATLTFGLVGGNASWLALEAELAGPLGDNIPVQTSSGAVRIEGAPQPTATPGTGSPPPPTVEPRRTTSAAGGAGTPLGPTAAATAGPTATHNPATPRPTNQGSSATNQPQPTQPGAGAASGGAADPPASAGNTGDERSAAQIALLSLGTVAGLSAAGLGAFWLAGRLSRGRHPPPGPWP
jgi:hypothetical protein